MLRGLPHSSRNLRGGQDRRMILNGLFAMIRETKRVDFTHYKQTTLQRRIRRRMVLNRIEKLDDYIRFAKRTPAELDQLYRDILIHVTGFFRDPGAYEVLREKIFPSLLQGRTNNAAPIRIWIPGCSTGEEAYSHRHHRSGVRSATGVSIASDSDFRYGHQR